MKWDQIKSNSIMTFRSSLYSMWYEMMNPFGFLGSSHLIEILFVSKANSIDDSLIESAPTKKSKIIILKTIIEYLII
jgi:hypothetical protein